MTPEQKRILAHEVVDPDAWWAHAQTRPNAVENLKAKVARIKPAFDAAQGPGYQNRAARDAAEEAAALNRATIAL